MGLRGVETFFVKYDNPDILLYKKNTLPHPVDLGLTDPTRQKSVITGMRERDGKRYTTYLAPSSKPRKLLGRTGVPGIYKLLN